MKKCSVATLICLVLIAGIAYGKIIHVPGDYPTIQAGIDAAVDGDTVLVADGTYNENIDFKGKAIVVMSESGPTKTTIHGTGIGDVVIGATGSTIQGFTITGGAQGVDAGLATMTIRGNIITGNWDGIFTANYREPIIENNIIYNNRAWGIDAEYYSAPIISNNTIAFNGGFGIASFSATGVVVNNIIVFNGSNGIYCSMPESSPEIRYNDVYGNQMGDYSGCEPGEGDISADPLFVDPGSGDYYLQAGSPCIDAGTPLGAPPDDIEGNPRDEFPDMGAYEYQKVSTGSINGTVTDMAGNPIKWALVIAVLGETKIKAFTDSDGYYKIPDLEPGTYWVLCIKKGHKVGIRKAEVVAGEETTVNFRLRENPE